MSMNVIIKRNVPVFLWSKRIYELKGMGDGGMEEGNEGGREALKMNKVLLPQRL